LVSTDAEGSRVAGDIGAAIKRLKMAIAARDEKIKRAAELAERARNEPHPEKALDLFLESENVWHNDDVTQMIHTLRSLLNEHRRRGRALQRSGYPVEGV